MSIHLAHKGYLVTGSLGDYRVLDAQQGPVYKAHTAAHCIQWINAYLSGEQWAVDKAIEYRGKQ